MLFFGKNEIDEKIRRSTLCVINKSLHNTEHISYTDKILENKIKKTNKFLKDNKEIFFTKADKGNVTVAIKKTEYINKVDSELSNTSRYNLETKNPLKNLKENTKILLDSWNNKGVFEHDDAFDRIKLNLNNTTLPRAYATIKIHKENNPIRIIVSSINSPLYTFDKSLSLLFKKYF